MTQRIIISILFLVTVSLGSKNAYAGRQEASQSIETKYLTTMEAGSDLPSPVKKVPLSPAQKQVPHKTVHAPHLEELPHIHRYHKERVKKLQQHTRYWFMGKLLVVLCHLSLLLIAYLHVVH